MIKAKWLSLENHVHNVHTSHGGVFSQCAHGQLLGREANKKWFKRRKCSLNYVTVCTSPFFFIFGTTDTKSSEKLTAILTNTILCKDIVRLSPLHQTSSLEAFHSVIIHFDPKYVALSYQGMCCR